MPAGPFFSDIVWQREPGKRSVQASTFSAKEYPNIATADAVVAEIAGAGFHPLDPVLFGRKAWSNYCDPLRDRLRLVAKRQDRPQPIRFSEHLLFASVNGEFKHPTYGR